MLHELSMTGTSCGRDSVPKEEEEEANMRRVIESKIRRQSLVAEPEQSAKLEFLVVTRTRVARCHFRHTRGALKTSIWSKRVGRSH